MASAPVPAPFRFRALPLSELLDETFRLYRRNFMVVAGVSLVVLLAGLVAKILSGAYRVDLINYYLELVRSQSNPGLYTEPSPPDVNAVLVTAAVGLIMLPFTGWGRPPDVGALFRAATELAAGRRVTIGSVLAYTLRRYFSVFVIVILGALVQVTGVLIITIPVVIWVAIRWSVACPALFAEGIGPLRALSRSWSLVRGHWWRTLGILLVVGILVLVIEIALGSLFGGIVALVPGLPQDVRSGLVTAATTLVAALVAPVTPIAVTLLYFDLRVRKEGFDLEQLARETSPDLSPA